MGYALAAISSDEVVKMTYMQDLLGAEYVPSGDDELGEFTDDDLKRFLNHPKTVAAIKDLGRYGEVAFGMLGGYEFIEL